MDYIQTHPETRRWPTAGILLWWLPLVSLPGVRSLDSYPGYWVASTRELSGGNGWRRGNDLRLDIFARFSDAITAMYI